MCLALRVKLKFLIIYIFFLCFNDVGKQGHPAGTEEHHKNEISLVKQTFYPLIVLFFEAQFMIQTIYEIQKKVQNPQHHPKAICFINN